MNTFIKMTAVLGLVTTSAACSMTPEAQHEVGCVGGTLAGAAIGAAIGNRFGGGNGQTIATAVGAATGGAATATRMGC